MDKLEKTKKISGIVFYSIWLALALILWIAGMGVFLGEKSFTTWILWGAMCIFPIIIPIFKMIAGSAKKGARSGANNYTASVVGNTVYVENHPFMGALGGIVIGILSGLFAGPIVLAFYVVKNTTKLVRLIVEFAKASKGV